MKDNSNKKTQTCENCKYWEATDSYPVKGARIGNCKKIKMFWDCTKWSDESDDYDRVFKKEFKEDKAFVQDGSDYMAYLITKKEFGCNQFSE